MTTFMSTMRQLFSFFIKGDYLSFLGDARTGRAIIQSGSTRSEGELVAGIDIGTTSIHTLIGQVKANGTIKIIGSGESKARGWRMGEVVTEEDAIQSVQMSVNQAELSAGKKIPPVILGISGEMAARQWLAEKKYLSTGVRPGFADAFGRKPTQIIHCHRRNGDSLPDPMLLMVGASTVGLERCFSCLTRSGITVKEVFWAPLSLGLGQREAYNSELETMIVDIGGTHTSVALYRKGMILDAFTLSIGGDDITNDIAIGFGITVKEAEQLKRRYGVASEKSSLGYTQLAISSPLSSRYNVEVIYHIEIARIIERRLQQMFSLVEKRLDETTPGDVMLDLVYLTGGGAAVEGMDRLATRAFGVETRFFAPIMDGGIEDVVSALRLTNVYGLMQLNRLKLIEGYRPISAPPKRAQKRFAGFRFAFRQKRCDNAPPNGPSAFAN